MSYGSLNIIPAGMPGGLSSNPRNSSKKNIFWILIQFTFIVMSQIVVTNYALPLSQASYVSETSNANKQTNK